VRLATSLKPTRRRISLGRGLTWLALCAAGLFFGAPLLWLILAPTKTAAQLGSGSPFAFGSLGQLSRSWVQLFGFDHGLVMIWMRNSLVYCGIALAVVLVVSLPAGYALAVTDFVGRRALLFTTMVAMLVPTYALVLPIFMEMHDVHLLGHEVAVILPFSFFPSGVYLAFLYFDATLPEDLLNAARLDGCSEWSVFRYIALPLSSPIVVIIAFFNIVANWSNFFLPFVLVQSQTQYPIALGLETLQSAAPPVLALGLLLSCAPVLVVLLVGQRALSSGVRGGLR
jgi:multiple sugar transport system permease protein